MEEEKALYEQNVYVAIVAGFGLNITVVIVKAKHELAQETLTAQLYVIVKVKQIYR